MTLLRSITLALTLGTLAALPAHAAEPDWWLVYSDVPGDVSRDRAETTVRFVDLASLVQAGTARQVTMLTIDGAGAQSTASRQIDCAGPEQRGQELGAVRRFVCGSPDYRSRSGLNIRDFPPAEIRAIYLRERAAAQ